MTGVKVAVRHSSKQTGTLLSDPSSLRIAITKYRAFIGFQDQAMLMVPFYEDIGMAVNVNPQAIKRRGSYAYCSQARSYFRCRSAGKDVYI